MRTPLRIIALFLGAFFVLCSLLFVFPALRSHLFGVFDKPAVQVQGETLEGPEQFNVISQRFLAGEISVDEAAGEIVTLMARLEKDYGIWALTFGSNYQKTSEEDQTKINALMDRIRMLLKDREGKHEPKE